MKRDVWLEEFRAKWTRIVFYILGVMIIFSFCSSVYQHQRDKALRAEPRKVYKAAPRPPENSVDTDAAKARAEWEAQQAKLKERLAETDALSNAIKAILQQAAPILANHLNSLSQEEQVAFLEQTRKTFMSQLPPDADSEGIETAWQAFLDFLSQHGYEPK